MKVKIRAHTVKELYMRLNKSQRWFARQVHVTSGYMSQLMDGTRNPSPKVRARIMKLFPELFEIVEE